MAKVLPLLHVKDMDESMRFYRDVLGFTVVFTMAGDSGRLVHAELNWNDVEVMLSPADELSEAARSLLGAGAILYIAEGNIDLDSYHDQVRDGGALVTEAPADQFWGDRTFSIKDPSGYNLTFARKVREFDSAEMSPVT